jgi:hypothetical protein
VDSTAIFTTVLAALETKEGHATICFVYCVSSISFKHILVVVGRRLKGIASEGFQRSFRERKSEGIQGRAAQNRTRKEGKETGRKGVEGKNPAI